MEDMNGVMVWIAFVFMGYGLDCHALLRKARNDRESSKASNDKTRFVDCFASLAMTEKKSFALQW